MSDEECLETAKAMKAPPPVTMKEKAAAAAKAIATRSASATTRAVDVNCNMNGNSRRNEHSMQGEQMMNIVIMKKLLNCTNTSVNSQGTCFDCKQLCPQSPRHGQVNS